MSYLSEISFRRSMVLLLAALSILAVGTWMTVKMTTDHLVNEYVKSTANDWAQFLAGNVSDLGEIAAGEQPSAASLAFFHATAKSAHVFRYVIFNRDGYSQLVVDPTKIAPVDLSEHSDHMHPHPFNEARVRGLLAAAGFEVVTDRVSDHKSHPKAYGEYRGLLRRVSSAGPNLADSAARMARKTGDIPA